MLDHLFLNDLMIFQENCRSPDKIPNKVDDKKNAVINEKFEKLKRLNKQIKNK